jgi:bifunctional enzyme Fae/Hps
MSRRMSAALVPNRRYIQIAFNHNLYEVRKILPQISYDPRIIIEAGTPFCKLEGMNGVRTIRRMWRGLVLADLKVTDGAAQEVSFAVGAGANIITCFGSSPPETLDFFTEACHRYGVLSAIDMLGVNDPLRKLLPLKNKPDMVVIHKGRDEEANPRNIIRYKDISKVCGKYDLLISVAGGIVADRVKTAYFNGASISILNIVQSNEFNEGISVNSNFQQLIPILLSEAGE